MNNHIIMTLFDSLVCGGTATIKILSCANNYAVIYILFSVLLKLLRSLTERQENEFN